MAERNALCPLGTDVRLVACAAAVQRAADLFAVCEQAKLVYAQRSQLLDLEGGVKLNDLFDKRRLADGYSVALGKLAGVIVDVVEVLSNDCARSVESGGDLLHELCLQCCGVDAAVAGNGD